MTESTFPENMRAYRSWRETPAEHQGGRVFGHRATDSRQGVDFGRLRAERLGRLQAAMRQHDLAALLLTSGDNVRYACAPPDVFWKSGTGLRYALVFPEGRPLLFETVGPDLEYAEQHCPWLAGRIHPAITAIHAETAAERQLRRWADQISAHLRSEGVDPASRVGVDTLDFVSHGILREAGVSVVPAGGAIKSARLVKTADELELLKLASQLSSICFYKLRHEWVRPGARECEVAGKIVEYYTAEGGHATGAIVATGCNTNPLFRGFTDKLIEPGDMCIVDLGFATYLGYGSDYIRCWPVAAAFTPSQREAYRRCYDWLQAALTVVRAGTTTADIAEHLPPDADDVYGSGSVLQAGHSVGLGVFDGLLISRAWSLEYPVPIEKNMYLAIETYCALPDGAAARLEENVVVTDTGYELYSRFPFEAVG
ncbi:MAG: aminopeptidase P family protein [Chloroflexi bacterium]|nr:aminopeptidase P family protein [Chloroflexota bacterium]